MRFATPIAGLVASLLLATGLTACGGDSPVVPADGRSYTDAAHRTVVIPKNPKRVITLAEGALDSALALGVTPIGSTAGRGQLGIPGYLATAAKDSDFNTPVSPARAPTDVIMNSEGVVTIAEVMATMRPHLRARIPGSTARTRAMGAR